MRLSFLAVLPLAGVLLTGAAPTSAPTLIAPAGDDRPERQCFSVAQVDNFRQARNQTVYVKVRNDDVYALEATGYCQDLDFATRLAIRPQLGASRLCTGDAATIVAPNSVGSANACRVRIVKRLGVEDVAALPDRDRP